MLKICLTLVCTLYGLSALGQEHAAYTTQNGTVHFSSVAPLEVIEAKSDHLQGVFDPAQNTFAFRLENRSFTGFNSALQKEHFNENYMESSRYRFTTFKGRIIESIDVSMDGTYSVRAKGVLSLHGIQQERIIKCDLKVVGDKILVKARFTILLEEYDIVVPRIVQQKIAPEILVNVEATLLKDEP
ncbi:MAG: YceI family protein [Saprospiraceae bacterium]